MQNSTLLKGFLVLTLSSMSVLNLNAGTPFKANVIPGTIEAEDYDTDGEGTSFKWNRADADAKKSDGGGYRTDVGIIGGPNGDGARWIGEMDGGVFTVYTVTIEEDGDYDLLTYYAKGNDGTSSFKLTIGDIEKTVNFDGNGAWESFTNYATTSGLHLSKGTVEIKFETDGGFNVDKFEFKYAGEKSSGHGLEIPGKIEAEEFDDGGEGVAYHWNDGNEGGAGYRSDAIHIGNGGTGHNIGWTANGDWARYTVNVNKTGYYKLTYNAASGADNGGSFYFADSEGNMITATCIVNKTDNWDTYVESSVTNVYLEEGTQTLVWKCGGGFNIDYFDFEYIGTTAEVTAIVPGIIQAEDYDDEGTVFTNADKAPGFNYRPNQKVFLEKNGDVINIGNTSGGNDVFSYSFTAEEGTYEIDAYVACGNDNGKFQIVIDSYDSGETAVPNIGWGAYDSPITLENVSLTAGDHVMKFYVLGDCNIDRFEFRKISDTTGINNIYQKPANNVWYNLNGQSVASPSHGIFIQNGKKIIIK